MTETPLFPPSEVPTVIGVYAAEHPTSGLPGYAHWDGRRWGLWCLTIEAAERCKNVTSAHNGDMHWRGLTRQGYMHELRKLRRAEVAGMLVC